MEEEEGFEPPRALTPLSVFKTDPFNQTWVFLRATFNNIQHLFLIVNDFYELFKFLLFYVPLFGSMDCYVGLWAVIRVYGPLCWAMSRYPVLWTVMAGYVPSSDSMSRYAGL